MIIYFLLQLFFLDELVFLFGYFLCIYFFSLNVSTDLLYAYRYFLNAQTWFQTLYQMCFLCMWRQFHNDQFYNLDWLFSTPGAGWSSWDFPSCSSVLDPLFPEFHALLTLPFSSFILQKYFFTCFLIKES